MSVNLVLVSHSHELVEGLRKILLQIQPDVKIGVAGGTDDNEIGTSALKIKQAIEEVYTNEGVAILFDLGSALLSAELALDMLDGKKNIAFCDAPLVEGAYAAIVEAGCGSTLTEVVESSEGVRKVRKLL